MDEIAAHGPADAEQLVAYAEAGGSWVATDGEDRAIGCMIVVVIDGCAHTERISAHPHHQGQRLARALIDDVGRWASHHGLEATTLTRFRDVPWSRPLYEHFGFTVPEDEELSPGLRALRISEASHGLDPAARVCMCKSVRHRPDGSRHPSD